MKFAGRTLCLAVVLLVLGVAGREVPELISLTDDVSNDGEVATRADEAVPQPRLLTDFTTGCYTAATPLSPKYFAVPRTAPVFVVSGPELLHRVGLQKK